MVMKLKTLLAPTLALILACGFTACSKTNNPQGGKASGSASQKAGHQGDGFTSEEGQETAEASPRITVSVADGIVVLDENLKSVGKFELGKNPKLAKLADSRHVGVFSDENTMHLLDAGSWPMAHGDHFHYFVGEPSVSDNEITGNKFGQSVADLQATAIFLKGSGEVMVLEDSHLKKKSDKPLIIKTKTAHDGIAVPQPEGHLLVTQPGTTGQIEKVDLIHSDGKTEASYPCSQAKGVVAIDEMVAFGCANSVLIVNKEKATTVATDPAQGRVTSIVANSTGEILLGNYSKDSLMLIKGGKATKVNLGVAYGPVAAAYEDMFAVLGVDGKLYVIDPNGKVTKDIKVLDKPWSLDAKEQPKLVAGSVKGRPNAWVADPASGKVYSIHMGTEKVTETTVGTNPTELVVTNSPI